ncbi:uncharacterized protein CYBJADRAFT_166998 [Cyberlindnera jadinii NRRL Y-1542]|uniref:Hydantoinase n=1 Tax=Cyberlindnera jadinii (strain ATCC 18201 / CBS 1600 / BCRC 20928 / JCM 3617 / NBRC 0987 / NRRL Y-1542) TaxID=983966 RepID=A0A1E4S4D4_CYBJN|nr:hypothetical protein CYBJADRAFT_166998 [Cyberlindnera jadinii NRRL Y-1542]ODV74310.1 hypothetical protein CYBJADRAFT_166998 [Cyberlindnera jadinii NRRL Y-1542]
MTLDKRRLLVGVDVGGTNSDLVVLDPSRLEEEDRGVIAWHKSVTTPDVSVGIEKSIQTVLENPAHGIRKDEIVSVTIGTTHFINAVIERDSNRLEKVAVIRLSGPFGRSLPPFGDFPEDLANVINGYHAFLDGGSKVDGEDIRPLDEAGLIEHCSRIGKLGISAIAVVGTFANMNPAHELRAREIIKEQLPECDVVLSHQISGIGFVERENATVLNASIKKFGRKIIKSFVHATKKIGLNCIVLLSQNDGTVLSVKDALEAPIRTFSSGATNSMRGAAILCSNDPDVKGKQVMVCDVGGTTTDVGQLLPSGFPRQSSMYSYAGGVKMNFSMPHVESIGLGGGSIVRFDGDSLSVGPDSTGADIITKSILFGGDTITTSDLTLAKYVDDHGVELLPATMTMGDPQKVLGLFGEDMKQKYSDVVKRLLEKVIDRMKTSKDPLPVIFVGGGSFIAPEVLEGASKVIKPPYFQVANAIGAALGKISATVSEIRAIQDTEEAKKNVIEELKTKASSMAVSRGALESSITVANVVSDAVPYLSNIYLFEVKVVGDVDYDSDLLVGPVDNIFVGDEEEYIPEEVFKCASAYKKEKIDIDYNSYRPTICDHVWTLSEVDIDFIGCGAYILGCGGGGDPNSSVIELKNLIKNGAKITVVTLDKFEEMTGGEGRAAKVAYYGSPTVSGERLHADEILECLDIIEKYEGKCIDGIFNFEVGGANGLCGLWAAYQQGIPFIDMDSLGRAYPTIWQSLTSVVHDGKGYPYTSLSNGNGLQLIVTSSVCDSQMENVLRDVLYHQGVHGACVMPTLNIAAARAETAIDTISLSWRIGRAVFQARTNSDLDNLVPRITAAVGASSTACLFKGKIVSVEKILKRGYGYGIVELEGLDKHHNSRIKIPFKNENIVVYKVEDDGSQSLLCSVPDLITLVDLDGNAIGTQDYRYGLIVYVMAFSPDDKWITPKAIEIGGPKGFGEDFENLEYKPIGKFAPTIPVATEFNS